jgi:outer membrane immunogenic protein
MFRLRAAGPIASRRDQQSTQSVESLLLRTSTDLGIQKWIAAFVHAGYLKGREMQKRLIAVVAAGLTAFAAGVGLADGPPANRSMMTAPVAPPSWSGFYVSGGFGYGAWTADTTTVSPITGVCVLCVGQKQGGDGVFGTASIGYDLQFHQQFLAGVFVDGTLGSLSGTIQDQGPFFAGTIKEDGTIAVGARAGMLVNPATLAYFTAGYSNAHFSGASMVTTFAGAPSGFATPGFSRDGWFIGSGVETMMWPGWFWRMEYRYADYGTATLRDTPAVGAAQASITFHPIEQTVRSEVVFKFH